MLALNPVFDLHLGAKRFKVWTEIYTRACQRPSIAAWVRISRNTVIRTPRNRELDRRTYLNLS